MWVHGYSGFFAFALLEFDPALSAFDLLESCDFFSGFVGDHVESFLFGGKDLEFWNLEFGVLPDEFEFSILLNGDGHDVLSEDGASAILVFLDEEGDFEIPCGSADLSDHIVGFEPEFSGLWVTEPEPGEGTALAEHFEQDLDFGMGAFCEPGFFKAATFGDLIEE